MSASTEADPTISNLLRWLAQGGASFPKIHVVSLGGGERGIFTQADLSAEEPILRIPRDYFITLEDARASGIGRTLADHTAFGEESAYLYLSAFLLQEKERGEGSFWKPFLDSLPKAFPTHPVFFTEEELALLKGSFLLELIPIQKRGFAARYAELCEQVPGFNRFSLDDFIWAHYAVVSRNFSWQRDGVEEQSLMPLADMINEGRPFNTRWGLAEDGKHFELTAINAVAAGTEVRTTYGNKSNIALMLHYGYLHEDNPSNEVQFALSFPTDVPNAEEKQRLFGLSEPGERTRFKLPISDITAVHELLAFLRVIHAEAQDLATLKAAPDPKARARLPLSPANEKKVIQAFISTCHKQLAAYDTPVEEDERLLREGKLSHNARSCVLLRRGEKRILNTYAQAYAAMAMMMP